MYRQIDATLNHPEFDLHLSANEGQPLASSEVLRTLDCEIVHFPGHGDFVFVRHPRIEGEFTVHTIFAGKPFNLVLKCARLALRLMADIGMDVLATYCPDMNRGAQALARGAGMAPVIRRSFGSIWGGTLADVLGKDKELTKRAASFASHPLPKAQLNALAAALHLLGDPTERPASPSRKRLLRRVVFMLSETGPVVQVPFNGQQHLLFGEAGVIIPVGPLA